MPPRAKGLNHVALYAASSWFAATLALGGLFVFVRLVSSSEFGLFTIWSATTTVISAGAAQWLRQAVLRYSSRYQDNHALFLRTIWVLTAATCAVIAIAAFTGSPFVMGKPFARLYVFGVLVIMLTTINMVQLAVWQAGFQPAIFALSKVTIGAGTAGFSLIVLNSGLVTGANALALGSLAGTALGVFVGVVVDTRGLFTGTTRAPGPFIDTTIARHVAMFGLPMIGWFLGSYALTVTDKTALAHWATMADLGAYGALISIATGIASLLITPLVMACHPTMTAAWNTEGGQEDAAVVASAYLKAFVMLAIPAVVFVWAAEPAIVSFLLPAAYIPTKGLFTILTAAMFTSILGLLAHKGLEMAEATGTLVGLILGSLVLNIALLVLLVPQRGATGAAIAVLLTQIAYVSGALGLSRRYMRVSLRPRFVAEIVFATAVAAWLTPMITGTLVDVPAVARLLATGACASVLYLGSLSVFAAVSWKRDVHSDWLDMWRVAMAFERELK